MIGAQTMAKRAKPRATIMSDPTPERLAHAGNDVEWGGDRREGRMVLTVRDAPIEKLRARNVISEKQYAAAMKFRIHWYRAGLSAPVHSLDLNRIFAATGSSCGMPATEAQAFHRQQYRKAVDEIGLQSAAIVTAVACDESNLEDVGYRLGWGNRPQAVAAATERLRMALGELVKWWGM